jgi:hypothetical protein
MKTLWRKNQENSSDRISHAWAPLMYSKVKEWSRSTGITVHKNSLGVRDWEGNVFSIQLETGIEKYVVLIHEEFEDIL